ncbi:T9SS type A sorting domain-containing protein [Hymenobacter convexus]|uniref:T9SS type A sorting domain-containing protein n=1 Tax=Hymenobacter sp. CA1UV-4 TaxID=3063782 RepID=UPI002712C049|nr:T9SS type A sorting domain-containing protein [Hymenobacter sp. CA1UV-4]MDO7854234.1 T9SS type A sorting domain-containing protein [Hymenobacter sp. CA1UV-4]
MKTNSILKWLKIIGVGLLALPAQAQYVFTDSNLGAYSQNFDALAGTKDIFISNSTAFPGVYARFTLDNFPGEYESSARGTGAQAKLGPDDGSEGPQTVSSVDADGTPHGAAWYHFGSTGATDRALGGIASTTVTSGKGYVGFRLRNSSSKTIVNLEVQYAMEQWYNSSQTQAATVVAEYQKSASPGTIASVISGTWLPISDLNVPAPSTSTSIAPRNGNAAANRRVKKTTLTNINLAVGQEIMIRFGYVFNSGTNGNGLSIDDVVITPETNVFYSNTTGNLTQTTTWGTNADGTGTPPANFLNDNQIFYVQSPKNADGTAVLTFTDRVGAGGTWTVGGANSKIVVGTTTSPAILRISSNDNINATIDVGQGSYFYNNHPGYPAFTLGTLAPTSTVEFNSGGVPFTVPANQYGNLKATGQSPTDPVTSQKILGGNLVVTGSIGLGNDSKLVLGDYDLTVLSTGTFNTVSANAYVVTNGTGRLRMQVPRGSGSTPGTRITFPVGSATSYTPVSLQQSSTASDDVFEVRVIDNAFTSYNATTYAPGATQVATEVVNRTWLVSKEVPTNPATVTMKLQWNTGDASTDFVATRAHINHFTGGSWERYMGEVGTAVGTVTNSLVATRTGITSFSPFSVSSLSNGALPVELTAFAARRAGAVVACAWSTASEKNSRHFTVERSRNGMTFEPLGVVAAAGNSSTVHTYSFADEHPLAGLAYYRLRQTDLDGTESFSSVVAVNGTESFAVPVVVPNPGTGRFVVMAADGQAIAGPFVVLNALGAVVRRVPAALLAEANAGAFDLSDQPAGLYLVQVQTAAGTHTLRVVKN